MSGRDRDLAAERSSEEDVDVCCVLCVIYNALHETSTWWMKKYSLVLHLWQGILPKCFFGCLEMAVRVAGSLELALEGQ